MVPTTERPASNGGWREETRNVEVPGMLDTEGLPFVVTIRRLPAASVYLAWQDEDKAGVPETWRRWAQQAIVSPSFNYNGNGDSGIGWDALPLIAHAALGRAIADYSFEVSKEAQALEVAFRGGQPAGDAPGAPGGRPGDDGGLAPVEPPTPEAPGGPTEPSSGAGV